MAEISWIKLKTTMFDDEKIRLIQSLPESDAILIIWIRLLVLAGKTNDDGLIYIQRNMPYSEEMLATLFNKQASVVKLALITLQKFEMIDLRENGLITIANWEKHQNIEGMDKVRQLNAERNRKYRDRKKQIQLECDVSVTSRDATDLDLDLDLELELDKEKDISKKPSKQVLIENDFQEIWKLYPKKTMKKEAFAAYKKAIKNGTNKDDVLNGVKAYLNELEANKKWLKSMDGGRWFKKARWTDTYENQESGEGDGRYDDLF